MTTTNPPGSAADERALDPYRRAHRHLQDAAAAVRLRLDPLVPDDVPALAGALADLCREVRRHVAAEERHVWPVLTAAAGPAVDLAPFRDDHQMLVRLTERFDGAARAALGDGPCTTYDAVGASSVGELQTMLADLADELDEHIADEESCLFALIRDYLPTGEQAALAAMVSHHQPHP